MKGFKRANKGKIDSNQTNVGKKGYRILASRRIP